ncbi:hypothetical protein V1478_010469 [Vespula squamosa]|uniref:Uncharacterized protein n=1 Tax=Vespula squamosa TaxID=30214 RepID=A0ABD2AHW2_VESSQ
MIPRGRTIGDGGGDQDRDQEDDAAAEQEPGTAGEADVGAVLLFLENKTRSEPRRYHSAPAASTL